jgi:pyruvate-ferredoxin/flavodoxin oxidoreductase
MSRGCSTKPSAGQRPVTKPIRRSAAELDQEFVWFREALGDFKFSVTQPYWSVREKKQKGSGGLLSITVNPYTCKGCMECVKVCNDDAHWSRGSDAGTIREPAQRLGVLAALPTTPAEFIRIENLDERIGALETLLLDKRNYSAMVGGDGACLGCGEKTVVHLFTATVEALMQPRVAKQVQKIDELIARLDRHVRLKLADTMDLSDTHRIEDALTKLHDTDVTLANFSGTLDERQSGKTIDAEWLRWVTQLLAKLKHLRWQYVEGPRTGPRQHGHYQLDGLHVGVGFDVSVQSVSVPVGQQSVPGFAVDGDGDL